jgi:hypothetical protein
MPQATIGQRVKFHRQRTGKTRAVVGGLVGRSEEWVKALETGRLLTPRLPMLLRLAEVLGLSDLAQLTGEQSVPVASVTRVGHESTALVAAAMSRPPRIFVGEPSAPVLAGKVDQAWELWHRSSTERTAIAAVLPELLTETRAAVRALDGTERRSALAQLARVYHLTQLFLAHQPAAELVWLAADRGMTAAQDADDPAAMAVAAWYYGHVYRGAGQFEQAHVVARDVLTMLDPSAGGEQLARWGLLHLDIALGQAKAGRSGLAWQHFDHAARAAGTLGPGYVHPWLMFGPAAVEGYAVTIETDLWRPGEAIGRAARWNVLTLPSRTRRASYLIDAARAHSHRREHVAVAHLLGLGLRQSVDTVKFSSWARGAVLDLLERRGLVREDARELALAMDLMR